MSEQDAEVSSRLETALLEHLARQEERISLLEAQLEATRRPSETREHPPRKGGAEAFEMPPPQPMAPLPSAEHKPIALSEFAGPRMDAIAEIVFEKASEQTRATGSHADPPTAYAPTFPLPEAEEAGYEPTARWNAQHVRRQQRKQAPRTAMLRKAGALALLSIAIAALSLAAWQPGRTALLSAFTPDIRPLPPLTPPPPLLPARSAAALSATRPLRRLPSTRPFTRKQSVVELLAASPELSRPEHRFASNSSAVQSQTTPSHAKTKDIPDARQPKPVKVAVASTRLATAPRAFPTPRRQTPAAHGPQEARNEQTRPNAGVLASLPVTRRNRALASTSSRIPDTPPSPQPDVEDELRSSIPDDRNTERVDEPRAPVEYGRRSRARHREAGESYKVSQPAEEEAPRSRSRGNVRRAMNTLDEMQDLLDSIERRKRRRAEEGSE